MSVDVFVCPRRSSGVNISRWTKPDHLAVYPRCSQLQVKRCKPVEVSPCQLWTRQVHGGIGCGWVIAGAEGVHAGVAGEPDFWEGLRGIMLISLNWEQVRRY